MNDIYKILVAATVGFLLSPLTEILKTLISSRQQKSKLIAKLKTFEIILCRAIRTTTKTIKDRESFIENPEKHLSTAFIIPNFNFPKIDSNIDSAYHMLSSSQRSMLLDLESQGIGIEKHLKKLSNIVEECKSTIYHKVNITKEIKEILEVRDIEKEHFTRALACEKAILYSAACMLATARRIIKNDPKNPNDRDTIKDISDELNIEIDLNWWQSFRNQ
ncbi:hypothetical protein HBO02_21505 [Pseudomonas proteolytica]|uniref:hypothetical protein n=1 Tax=Pseudomonas proteolytica TaxID=219574 RepID=UPI0014743DBE|nr:hypothetical protein [Pseudomonas proteolytica]NMZ24999.1 hypothetical protein [Pseudomonas proteolytica]